MLAAGALLGATGCGGSSESEEAEAPTFESVLASVEGMSGEARRTKLVELAQKQGGELSLYTSMGADHVPVIVEAFEDAFDLDVAVYRAGGETVVPRLLEEAEAGFHGADVVRINGLGMVNLHDAGLLVDYDSEYRGGLIQGSVAPGWTADSFSTFVVSWNTDLVSEDERPTSWEALADRRWRGRVAIEASDVDWYKALHDYWVEGGKTEEEADRLFETIARNSLVVHGHSLLGQLMAAGEIAVGPNYASRVESLREEGAPLAWQPAVEPIFPQPQGVGLVEGARHPAAAVLFYDWLLSDGQKLLTEINAEPARLDLAASPSTARRVIDVAALAPVQDEWTDRYDALLRLGKEAEESG